MGSYAYAHEGTLFPTLPEGSSVNIEKKFLQKIKTQPAASPGKGPHLNPPWTTHRGVSSEGGRLGATGTKLDIAASSREGAVVLKSGMVEPSVAVKAVKKASAPPAPIKETVEVKSKASKRRDRKKAKQNEDQAPVPLNSRAPAPAGDPTMNGQPQFLSQRSLRLLESRGVRL